MLSAAWLEFPLFKACKSTWEFEGFLNSIVLFLMCPYSNVSNTLKNDIIKSQLTEEY